MTTHPVPPDDWVPEENIMADYETRDDYIAISLDAARLLLPPGYVAVRTDDLRVMVDLAVDGCSDHCGDEACDARVDRLRAAMGEQP